MASWCMDDKPVSKCYMCSIFGCGFTEQAHLFVIRYFTLSSSKFHVRDNYIVQEGFLN